MPSDKKNSFWLSIQFMISIIFSLITIKLNIIHFGKEIFGIWLLLASIWGFGSIVDFGFGLAIVKYIAQYQDENDTINRILSSIFFVFLFLGLSVFILGLIIGYLSYFNNPVLIPNKYLGTFITVFVILGLSFLFQYLSIFFKSVFEGLNKFTITSMFIIIQNSLILLGVITIYILKLGIIWLALLYLLSTVFLALGHFIYYKFVIRIYKISIRNFEFVTAKKIFGFSVSIQLMNICNALIDPVVKYMLGNFYSINSIPAYEIARRFATAISGLFFNAFKIILPKASSIKTNSERLSFVKKDVFKYSRLGVTYSGFAFGICLLPLMIFINIFFNIKESLLIFMILALPESINNYGYSIYNFLLGIGKISVLVFIQLNNLIFVIISCFLGFKIFHNSLGLLGYFLSVVIGNIIMLYYLHKEMEITMLSIIKDSNLFKLVLLISIMCLSIVIFYLDYISFYILFSTLSITSFFIFYTSLKESANQLLFPLLMKLYKQF